MRVERAYLPMLILLGFGWGATQPLGKIAASTGHPPFGLIFWQLAVCVLVLGAMTLLRGMGLRGTPEALRFYVIIAILGTLVPSAAFYLSIARLPAGIMSILISAVPLFAFPLALALGMDRFSGRRLLGLALGMTGVALIALPEASLPEAGMVAFLPLALIGPLFYAFENTYVARFGMAGMDAVQAMFGASLVGLILCVPVMFAFGDWFMLPLPFGPAEWALIGSSGLHALLYASFVWLTSRAGSVFAAQTSYIVTASGVVWAMVILGERFSPWVWAAMAVMLAGIALVRPRVQLQQDMLQKG